LGDPDPSGGDADSGEQAPDGEGGEHGRERKLDAGDVEGDEEDGELRGEESDHAQGEPVPRVLDALEDLRAGPAHGRTCPTGRPASMQDPSAQPVRSAADSVRNT